MWLGIDTSGAVSVAVARGRLGSAEPPEILSVRSDVRARHHDEVLLGLVDDALHDAGVRRGDLEGVVVGRGPGPFTGLRVGLVVARTIAAALDIPLHGVCSLDALALQSLDGASDAAEGRIVAVALDARRREVYWALYDASRVSRLTRTEGPAVSAPADVADRLTAADVLVGSGAELYPELLPATASIPHADAGALITVASQLAARGVDLSSTEPLYLREPDAAKPSVRKSALGLGDRPGR